MPSHLARALLQQRIEIRELVNDYACKHTGRIVDILSTACRP
jgi:hypothetical protein